MSPPIARDCPLVSQLPLIVSSTSLLVSTRKSKQNQRPDCTGRATPQWHVGCPYLCAASLEIVLNQPCALREGVMRKLVIAAGIILTSACVRTSATVLNPEAQRSPICADGVQLFTSAEKIGKEYHEVAVLNSKGDGDMTSEEGMANSQRKKAAKLGAN